MHNLYPAEPDPYNSETWQQPHDVEELTRTIMGEPGTRSWVPEIFADDGKLNEQDREDAPVNSVAWLSDGSTDQYTVSTTLGIPGTPHCLYRGATLTMQGGKVLGVEGSHYIDADGNPVKHPSPLETGSGAEPEHSFGGNATGAEQDVPTASEELAFAYRLLDRIHQNRDDTGGSYVEIAA